MADERTWWRHAWMKSVYASDLCPQERLIAAIYADHAWNARMAWVTNERLAACAGMTARRASEWRNSLITKKWLIEMEKARHHKAAIYFLSIPEGYESDGESPVDSAVDSQESGWTPPTTQDDRVDADGNQGGRSRSSGWTGASTNPSSEKSSYPSSSSSLTPRQRIAQQITGLDEDDDLLKYVSPLLDENNVKNAKPWMGMESEYVQARRSLQGFTRDVGSNYFDTPTVVGQTPADQHRHTRRSEERLWIEQAIERGARMALDPLVAALTRGPSMVDVQRNATRISMAGRDW